jgi:hypothetical protein
MQQKLAVSISRRAAVQGHRAAVVGPAKGAAEPIEAAGMVLMRPRSKYDRISDDNRPLVRRGDQLVEKSGACVVSVLRRST